MRDTYETVDLPDPWRGRYLSVREPGLRREERRHVYTRVGTTEKLIPIEQVILFKADQKYTVVCHTGGENLIVNTLIELEELFPSQILRIHRGMLINKARIESCERDSERRVKVKLAGSEKKFLVGRRHVGKLREVMQQLSTRPTWR